ncbi:hypothetical protein F5Y16DRAFT_23780 [Xylariaceae sp. FL0255]|nr:hypothetical protein F5Y16DRAFT_23780 [Xylariaceae sp. FL0255]
MRTRILTINTILIGAVALAAARASAQGSYPFLGQNPWGDGGDSGSGSGSGNDGSGGSSSGGGNGGSGSGGNGNNNFPYSPSSDPGGSSTSFGFGLNASNAGFDIESALRYRTIHGFLATAAFAFFFPLGSIVMRVVPNRHTWVAHGLIQLFAYMLYIVAAGLGLYLVSIVRIPPRGTSLLTMASTNAHPIIGVVLLGVIFLQPFLGIIHHRRFKRLGRRTWVSHTHLWIGRLGITLGIINGGLGLSLSGNYGQPLVAYSVIAGIMWTIWMFSALYGEFRRAESIQKAKKEDDSYANNPPPVVVEPQPPIPYAMPPPISMFERDIPSPPYTPGPDYQSHIAHAANNGERSQHPNEMRNMKEVLDQPDTMPTLSSFEGMGRGQV